MDKFIVSSFDGSDHNPFDKIFLYKWINQNDCGIEKSIPIFIDIIFSSVI